MIFSTVFLFSSVTMTFWQMSLLLFSAGLFDVSYQAIETNFST